MPINIVVPGYHSVYFTPVSTPRTLYASGGDERVRITRPAPVPAAIAVALQSSLALSPHPFDPTPHPFDPTKQPGLPVTSGLC